MHSRSDAGRLSGVLRSPGTAGPQAVSGNASVQGPSYLTSPRLLGLAPPAHWTPVPRSHGLTDTRPPPLPQASLGLLALSPVLGRHTWPLATHSQLSCVTLPGIQVPTHPSRIQGASVTLGGHRQCVCQVPQEKAPDPRAWRRVCPEERSWARVDVSVTCVLTAPAFRSTCYQHAAGHHPGAVTRVLEVSPHWEGCPAGQHCWAPVDGRCDPPRPRVPFG